MIHSWPTRAQVLLRDKSFRKTRHLLTVEQLIELVACGRSRTWDDPWMLNQSLRRQIGFLFKNVAWPGQHDQIVVKQRLLHHILDREG